MNYKPKPRNILMAIVLILIIALVGCVANNYLQYNVFYPLTHYDIVCAQAEKHDIDPMLIMAVVKAESGFKSDAVSQKGAVGLMQITPTTAVWVAEQMGYMDFDVKTLTQPQTNIEIGIWYIDYLLDYYEGHTQLALAAYNAGVGNVDNWLEDNKIQENGDVLTLPYKETSEYLININTYRERYSQLYEKENKPWWSFS